MSIFIPIIRSIDPKVIAAEIVGVQPMTSGGEVFKLKYVERSKLPEPKQGDWRHSFIHGYQRYYGTAWISTHLWWKIKIKGL
jgi:hypothetical protein